MFNLHSSVRTLTASQYAESTALSSVGRKSPRKVTSPDEVGRTSFGDATVIEAHKIPGATLTTSIFDTVSARCDAIWLKMSLFGIEIFDAMI